MGIPGWIGSNSRRLAASLCFLVRAVLISGRTDPIAAGRSWKIRRFMLQARLASVILASARLRPMVRMKPKARQIERLLLQRKPGIAMSIPGLPSGIGSLPGCPGRLVRPDLVRAGPSACLARILLSPGVALPGHGHQRRIDDVPAHRETAAFPELVADIGQ